MINFREAGNQLAKRSPEQTILTQDHYTTYALGTLAGAGVREFLAGDVIGGTVLMGIAAVGGTISLTRNLRRMGELHPAPGG